MLRFFDDIREALGIDRKHTPPDSYKPLSKAEEDQAVTEFYQRMGWPMPSELEEL